MAVGQLDNFASFTANLADLATIEGTALQEQALNLDGAVRLKPALLEGGDKLELVDGDLVDTGRLLAERVQECLRV